MKEQPVRRLLEPRRLFAALDLVQLLHHLVPPLLHKGDNSFVFCACVFLACDFVLCNFCNTSLHLACTNLTKFLYVLCIYKHNSCLCFVCVFYVLCFCFVFVFPIFLSFGNYAISGFTQILHRGDKIIFVFGLLTIPPLLSMPMFLSCATFAISNSAF